MYGIPSIVFSNSLLGYCQRKVSCITKLAEYDRSRFSIKMFEKRDSFDMVGIIPSSYQKYNTLKGIVFFQLLVGMTGFEPAALWSQTRCATKLRYIPASSI